MQSLSPGVRKPILSHPTKTLGNLHSSQTFETFLIRVRKSQTACPQLNCLFVHTYCRLWGIYGFKQINLTHSQCRVFVSSPSVPTLLQTGMANQRKLRLYTSPPHNENILNLCDSFSSVEHEDIWRMFFPTSALLLYH